MGYNISKNNFMLNDVSILINIDSRNIHKSVVINP